MGRPLALLAGHLPDEGKGLLTVNPICVGSEIWDSTSCSLVRENMNRHEWLTCCHPPRPDLLGGFVALTSGTNNLASSLAIRD